MMKRPELRELREAKKMTLEQVAEALGVSPSQISRFESGDREPRISEAVALAETLGVDIGELFPELRSQLPKHEQFNITALLDAVGGAFEMLDCNPNQSAALLKLVLSVAQEQPTPSAGPDFHRVLAEREARKFLQSKKLPNDGA